ncbi:response regulator transcription factor [Neiella sp. HB171785]|uniref:Response regulator transcription factor n=1 Tax=Neiella litorisoli TaxID=2771431 RepID=A0A8J6UDP5_9GAMM|nr:response regulator transcription factor [Neiella litorisoli]MBD1388274.1 response regulator transcription factor [Neiella litorisoli]
MCDKKTILVVDADHEHNRALQLMLENNGYRVLSAHSGQQMQELSRHSAPDLIILDVMLPGEDGFQACRDVRSFLSVPIILLAADSDEMDKVMGLDAGADDYLDKPYGKRELLARIRAQFRRSSRQTPTNQRYYLFLDWLVDTQMRRLQKISSGESEPISSNEYTLLRIFIDNPSRVLSRDDISDYMRGRQALPTERGLDVLMSRLRQRLGDCAKNPRLIKTIRGSGYVFVAEVSQHNELDEIITPQLKAG